MIIVIAIVSISSIPDVPTLKVHLAKNVFRLDYLIHFCQFGLLTLVAFIAYSDKEFNMRPGKILLLISCIMLFALADEFHQKLIPGRTFNLKDIYSNLAGIIAATFFAVIIFRRIRYRMRG